MSDRKKYSGIAEAFDALPEKTRKHSERVGEYMRIIFTECCFNDVLRNDHKAEARLRDDFAEMAYRIGLYHNVGKAFIPEELHFWSEDFTSEEKALYRKYEDYTKKLIFDCYRKEFACGAREETYAYEAVVSMHENWDGSGYPEGLEGKKIPVLSRVLACADALDYQCTMTRSDKPFEDAIAYLTEKSGTLFDKAVVNVIKGCKANLFKVFRQNIEYTQLLPKTARTVPASGQKTVALQYRTVTDAACETVGIEAKPKFKIGDVWTDFDGVAYLFADTKEKQNKQFRKDMCLYLAAEACDTLRRADAAHLSFPYALVKLPAAFLKLPGAADDLLSLLRDEEIAPARFRINAEAGLFTGSTAAITKNIKVLTEAGCGVMMSGVALADSLPEKPADFERVTLTPEQVIETGVNFFRIGEADEEAVDSDEGVARYQKLRAAGIVFTADNLDEHKTKSSLSLLEVKDFTGATHGAYTDADTLLNSAAAMAAG